MWPDGSRPLPWLPKAPLMARALLPWYCSLPEPPKMGPELWLLKRLRPLLAVCRLPKLWLWAPMLPLLSLCCSLLPCRPTLALTVRRSGCPSPPEAYAGCCPVSTASPLEPSHCILPSTLPTRGTASGSGGPTLGRRGGGGGGCNGKYPVPPLPPLPAEARDERGLPMPRLSGSTPDCERSDGCDSGRDELAASGGRPGSSAGAGSPPLCHGLAWPMYAHDMSNTWY